MDAESVILALDHGLATLTLNRPDKMNALNGDVFSKLQGHVGRLERLAEEIGVVIVRGSGRCFSAGYDLGAIDPSISASDQATQSKIIERLADLPQAVIMAVHGHCYTGALELALAGDLILASSSARFADTHAKWALTPIWGMTQRLPRRVGIAKAREMMLTCQVYDGPAAEQMGLANACFPDEGFFDRVTEYARSILANSSFSIRALKRLLSETDGLTLQAGLAHEVFRCAGMGPDIEQRIAKFGRIKS
jgi:enoyl-CoA hydratase